MTPEQTGLLSAIEITLERIMTVDNDTSTRERLVPLFVDLTKQAAAAGLDKEAMAISVAVVERVKGNK